MAIRRFFNGVGALLTIIGCALDIVYLWKSSFYAQHVFLLMSFLWALRIAVTTGMGAYIFRNKVIEYRPTPKKFDAEHEEVPQESEAVPEDDVRKQGFILYMSLPMMLYTGSYRALPSESFGDEITVAYIVEFLFTLLPMTVCMIWTNAEGAGKLTPI